MRGWQHYCIRQLLYKKSSAFCNGFLLCKPIRDQLPVACRAFPGGRLAQLEGQNEEENEEKLRKNERKHRKMRKN